MKRTLRFLMAGLLGCLLLMVVMVSHRSGAQVKKTAQAPQSVSTGGGSAQRGKYLVEEVAVCSNCHTPRLGNGELDRSRWLQGGSLFFQPPQPIPDWPIVAPRIGGAPPATDEQMVTLLTTGIWTTGQPLRQPMPRFHMSKEDAEAVIAYLKTVKPAHDE